MKIAIVGYGQVGKSVEKVARSMGIIVQGIYSRRTVTSEGTNAVFPFELLESNSAQYDVAVLCLSSADDMVVLAPQIAKYTNTVDCYDNHSKFSQYKKLMNAAASPSGHTSAVGCGWDTGLFSLIREMFATFGSGRITTLWGEGVSRGHTNAVKNVDGVVDALAYTIPLSYFPLQRVARKVQLTPTVLTHMRRCYVVARSEKDKLKIAQTILNMPDYFDGYRTEIRFVTLSELLKKNSRAHKGQVIFSSKSVNSNFTLELSDNAEFTARVMLNYANAVLKMNQEKKFGVFSISEIPLSFVCKGYSDFE